ncbi:SDR family NAD(P)-dependent oxidoreductase [Telmatospirillum sp.]|uniref:SDR family NAD(P)-dependent oxidoreductase n=1 Tax=Telmatospirillum sp. TaxID=2079197 RepID=UPI002845D51B|nr:SDR family NAD(P)-dependent oxidoreductase [Telmatospirillum sp.]MDR3437208.1 SDR family NAD(P)-dependent oxidoreductase [Telmatospirillum sp.]
MAEKPLAGRLALVTGASRGIGAAVAKRFSAEGAHVILLARTQGALEEVDDEIRKDGGEATLVTLDLRNADAIDQMGLSLYQRFGRLDILVGNAAVLGGLSPVGHFAIKDWAEVMAVNVTANWRLIRSFDALMRQSDAGRAIFVTSRVARETPPYWGAYAASKAALETMAKTWAAEVASIGTLKVNLVDPGIVRTRMRAQAFPGEDPLRYPAPEAITQVFVDLAAATCARHGEIVEAY